MHVLFLDIDGVLNRFTKGYSTPHHIKHIGDKQIITQMEPEMVYRLNLIVDRTECALVLSSSWRHDPEWRQTMRENGIVPDFLDRTPVSFIGEDGHPVHESWNRGEFIKKWLDAHPEFTKYAILDDNDDMLPEQQPSFFKTDVAFGLTQEIADKVEKHLCAAQ